MPLTVRVSDQTRREIYGVLNLRDKIESGQAYLETRRNHRRQPDGDFPPGTRSEMVNIRLSINDFLICVAHRYITDQGRSYTQADPKRINIDDLSLVQERPTRGGSRL